MNGNIEITDDPDRGKDGKLTGGWKALEMGVSINVIRDGLIIGLVSGPTLFYRETINAPSDELDADKVE